jgi:hypothetical protein
VITISISVNPFQYTAQTNLAAGTWPCFAHRSSELNSKHAAWVVLDAFLGPSARALMQNAALGEFWEGYAWVRLDLVMGIMGWVMQANQRMEWWPAKSDFSACTGRWLRTGDTLRYSSELKRDAISGQYSYVRELIRWCRVFTTTTLWRFSPLLSTKTITTPPITDLGVMAYIREGIRALEPLIRVKEVVTFSQPSTLLALSG